MKLSNTRESDVGASKAISTILGSLDRRLRNPAGSLVRFWGAALFLFVLYLSLTNTFENNTVPQVIRWLFVYGVYLFVIESIRKFWTSMYDLLWFRVVRLVIIIILVSWLISIPTNIRSIFAFAFTVPIFAAIVYLASQPLIKALMLGFIGVGVYLGGISLSSEPLEWERFVWIILALLMMYLSFDWFYKRAISHSENHLTEFFGSVPRTLDLQELLQVVMQIAINITNAKYGLIIVINPHNKNYIDHVLQGFSLKDGHSIEDVSDKCSVLGSGHPFESPDLQKEFNDTNLYHKHFDQRPRSILAEPLYNTNGEVLGVINIAHDFPNRFDQISQIDLRELAFLVGNAVENCFVHRELKLREARNREVNEKFSLASDENDAVTTLVNEIRELIPHAERYVLHRFNPETEILFSVGVFSANEGISSCSWVSSQGIPAYPLLKLGYGIAGRALEQRETIRVNNVVNHPWYVNLEANPDAKSLLVGSLFDPNSNELFGTISLESLRVSAFNLDDEIALANLSMQCARTISIKRNIQLLKEQGSRLRRILEKIRSFDLTATEKDLCEEIVQASTDLLGFKIARIRIMPPNESILKTIAICGITENERKNLKDVEIPYSDLEPFLLDEYRYENSFQVPHNNSSWQAFVQKYFDIPKQTTNKLSGWRAYDSLISPLYESSGKPMGILTLDVPITGRKPNHTEMELINVFANAASWMMEINRYQRRLKDQTSRAKSFIDTISSELAKASDLTSISEIVVQVAVNLLSVEGCSLFRVVGNEIELINSNYLVNFKKYRRRKPISDNPRSGLTSWVASRGEVLRFNYEEHKNHEAWGGEEEHLNLLPSKKCQSLLIAPVKDREGKVIGVISLENKKTLAGLKIFDDEDVERVIDLASETGEAWQVIDRYKAIEKFERLGLEDDLHDLINWYHSGVVLWIDSVNNWLGKGNIEKVKELMPQLIKQAYATNYELKSLHTSLLTKSYEAVTLQQAFKDTIDTWIVRYPPRYDGEINVSLKCPVDLKVPAEARSALVRVASLAFSNAINHSGIMDNPEISIVVEIIQRQNTFIMSISDDGKGMVLDKIREGYGISRMKQLIERLNTLKNISSKLIIDTGVDKGTKIIVEVFLEHQRS